MNDYKKYALIALVAIAVIVAAVAAIVVSSKRAETATALAEAAASEAEQEKAVAKTAAANAAAEEAKARAKEAEAKAAADNRKAKASEAEAAKEAAKKAEIDRKAAAENRAAKEAEATAARDARETAKIAAETAASEKAKALATERTEKAKSEKAAYEHETEKLRSERVIAEAKKLELGKIDFETWSSNLREWEQDLADRERALTPEKTITDLDWAGGMEDSVFDEDGKLCKRAKVAYRAEDDKTLPRSSRQLAKTLRELDEMASNETSRVRAAIVTPLEKEYAKALKEDRVLDANYIADAIKLLYPDWKFTVEETKETEGTEETEQDLNNERQQ